MSNSIADYESIPREQVQPGMRLFIEPDNPVKEVTQEGRRTVVIFENDVRCVIYADAVMVKQ